MVEKKQLLIIGPFWGRLSFETRNRLNSCIRNQLPFCLLTIVLQSKTRLPSWFKSKDSIPKYLHSYLLFKCLCNCCNTTYYVEPERHLFVQALEHLAITLLTQKRIKNSKKFAIMDYFMIKRDKLELNRNIYTHQLKLFAY